MSRLSTIQLFKEEMKFSAAHFTIFTKDVRENLHGHNYYVSASYTTIVEDEGLTFNYLYYRDKICALCSELNKITLLAGNSKHLRFEESGDYWNVYFKEEKMIFLKRDVKILPITNVTVEELSNYFLTLLLADANELDRHRIEKIKIKVFSGPGQSGSSIWRRTHA
jgi:6-pyruvoyltetrahydropterin/6-carboxytetrahydropterin synthase